tara:strand:- start:150 stop:1136 length:987 start_codon:yes stop_codon:yes gene_type:complete
VKNKPIIIVSGEPYGVFLEIFFKILKKNFYKKYKRPILLIGSKKMVLMQMKKMNFAFKINLVDVNKLKNIKLDNKKINLVNVNLNFIKPFGKITNKSSKYIEQCFKIGINIMKKKLGFALVNGPISKKHFLNGRYEGITEYLAAKTYKKNKEVMLIYNKYLSVCPITTHIPLKNVSKKISSKLILNKISTINNFFRKKLKKIPKFALTGLNPHCESNFNDSEEEKIIKPVIKKAQKRKINIKGPFPADTLFMKNNIKKFDVVVGMYHDQVITPMKTIYNFNAINITLGLPFIRISPDHGTNNQMLGKNKSNSESLKEALNFLKNIRWN